MSTIARLHYEHTMAERRLKEAIRLACPGKHQPRQHRDRMPPWCPECGRTAFGVQIRDDRA